jgi:hypothetical protein
VKLPLRASVKIALVVKLGREGARLPRHQAFALPAPLEAAVAVPQIALDAGFASTPAKIRAAIQAFSKGLFRDTFNPS